MILYVQTLKLSYLIWFLTLVVKLLMLSLEIDRYWMYWYINY
jgi:hypothetical protein